MGDSWEMTTGSRVNRSHRAKGASNNICFPAMRFRVGAPLLSSEHWKAGSRKQCICLPKGKGIFFRQKQEIVVTSEPQAGWSVLKRLKEYEPQFFSSAKWGE